MLFKWPCCKNPFVCHNYRPQYHTTIIMFSRVLFFVSLLAAFTPWTLATTNSSGKTPAAPGLTYLYTLNCTLGTAIVIGPGPVGLRVAIPIIGGYFNGPKLSGKLPT